MIELPKEVFDKYKEHFIERNGRYYNGRGEEIVCIEGTSERKTEENTEIPTNDTKVSRKGKSK